MKSSEEAIERVLAGLRDAEAPEGMERRILNGLEGRCSVQTQSGWRQLMAAWTAMPATRTVVCGLALAGLAAVVVAIPAIRRHGRVPVPLKINVVPGVSTVAAPSVATGEKVTAARSAEASGRWGMAANPPEAGLVRAADADEDSVAKSEMEAASFPAPPMPLTAQERLLLRLVHKVDPVEMAMLDPKFRAMQEAEEKAEFQRFFGQVATKQADPVQASGESTADQAAQPSTMDQGVVAQPLPDQAVPAQPAMDQAAPTTQEPAQNQPIQKQATPEQSSPDQSKTQQPITTPTGTGAKQ